MEDCKCINCKHSYDNCCENIKSREYYEEKKQTWYKHELEWNQKYSKSSIRPYTELAKPYSENTVCDFEKEFDIIIPSCFRKYLTEISSETIGYHIHSNVLEEYYPRIYMLNKFGISYDHNPDTELFENLFMKTHENGCTDDYYLCIKGKFYGHYAQYHNYDRMSYFSIFKSTFTNNRYYTSESD